LPATTRRLLWLVAWVIATALIYVIARGLDRELLRRVANEADGWWLLAAVASNAVILPLGAIQWRTFLPSSAVVATRRLIALFSLTSLANNTTPAIVGHVTGVLLLAAEPSVGRAAALSVLALDQIAVGLAKLTVLIGASLLLPLPDWITRGLAGLAVIVSLLLGIVLLAAHQHKRAAHWSESRARGPFLRGVLDLLSRWTRDLEALRSPRRFAAGLGCALTIKAAEASAIFAVQHAFGLELPWTAVVIVLAATSLATVVPFAPANIGTYEAGVFAAYRHLGIAPETALVLAVAQHCCQLVPAVGVGYVIISRRRGVATQATQATQRP